MTPKTVQLPEGRVWLRVAKSDWVDPLDPYYAQRFGGRWNPTDSFPTLYLNADVMTARLQIERMCMGTPTTPDDLADDAYLLIAATLPTPQQGADAVSEEGLSALELPASYPLDAQGDPIGHSICRVVGLELQHQGSRGVWCRSASSDDGHGREFAWFSGAQRAVAVWDNPLPFGRWRHADRWVDIELTEQVDPN